jgi:D-galacturonate reductase
MIGSGEYTTGYVGGAAAKSDKSAGVVALVLFDQRMQGKVGRLGLCGTNGTKFAGMRAHMARAIGARYAGLDRPGALALETWPADDVPRDVNAYAAALAAFAPGDFATIFTPDDTHFAIAMACVERGLHVLVTKPVVKTLAEHRALAAAARRKNVLVCVEVHKRWDPLYADARDRIRGGLGGFGYLNAYMSQPKSQLETFRAWAGKSSDISYYLNSHHIDFHEWCLAGKARPTVVSASSATGVAGKALGRPCEDTICVQATWENMDGAQDGGDGARSTGTAVYTSSWAAPPSDVHSQQRFFYMGQRGEVRIDQAHRGYSCATDSGGFASCNPLFMKYEPDAVTGAFAGRSGYGYRSFAAFVDAVRAIRAGTAQPADFDARLPTVHATKLTTAVLEAGRRSLDANGAPVRILYGGAGDGVHGPAFEPTGLAVATVAWPGDGDAAPPQQKKQRTGEYA